MNTHAKTPGYPGTYWLMQIPSEKLASADVLTAFLHEQTKVWQSLQDPIKDLQTRIHLLLPPRDLLQTIHETTEQRKVRDQKVETLRHKLALHENIFGLLRAIQYECMRKV